MCIVFSGELCGVCHYCLEVLMSFSPLMLLIVRNYNMMGQFNGDYELSVWYVYRVFLSFKTVLVTVLSALIILLALTVTFLGIL